MTNSLVSRALLVLSVLSLLMLPGPHNAAESLVAPQGISGGFPKGEFGEGAQTDEVTEPGDWRWSERFYGLRGADAIETRETCGESHTYVHLLEDRDMAEYLMKFGEDEAHNATQLVLVAVADDPAPVQADIYIDGFHRSTVFFDAGDGCNQEVAVEITQVPYGSHVIGVMFANDYYVPDTGDLNAIDRNLYLDALRVIELPLETPDPEPEPEESTEPAIPDMPREFGEGVQTKEVTEPEDWRWSERYYTLRGADAIETRETCGVSHTYVDLRSNGDTAEYLMKFGEDETHNATRLVVVAAADDPAPVQADIHIDGALRATAFFDAGDGCNQEVALDISDVPYGTHVIGVRFANDHYSPATEEHGLIDRNLYLDALRVVEPPPEPEPEPEIPRDVWGSLTNGSPSHGFERGVRTDAVTEPGQWRYAERFYGLSGVDVIERMETCGEQHTYVEMMSDGDTGEYLMKIGEDESHNATRLELVAIADDPAPVEADIYVDGVRHATVSFDAGDGCNQTVEVDISGIAYGTHAIAVMFTNDHYIPATADGDAIDRNLFFDALRVMEVEDERWTSLTGGVPRGAFGDGVQTDEVTEPGEWRPAERFYGLRGADAIEARETCGVSHIAVDLMSDGDTAEYLMMIGQDQSHSARRLRLVAVADTPGPVKADIYVDATYAATAYFDAADGCAQEVAVDLPGLEYGTHTVGVTFANDYHVPDTGDLNAIDRNLILDGLIVEEYIPTTVTVVTHGANLKIDAMAEELHDYWDTQPGNARLDKNKASSGELIHQGGPVDAPNRIILFEWTKPNGGVVKASSACASGMDEAAGDAMFVMLLEHGLLDSDYLHLIGYSRGATVVSEAAQRLLHYGYRVDQMTLLDQEQGAGLHTLAGPPKAWEGIGFVDNYYGYGSWAPNPCAGNEGRVAFASLLQGEPVPGAYNKYLDKGHKGVRDWYAGTIGTNSEDGFALRRNPVARQAVPEDGSRAPLEPIPSVTNGDFTYRDNSAIRNKYIAGWSGHGGGGGGDRSGLDGGVLRLSRHDEHLTHNRLYIPADATHVEYDMRRTNKDGGLRRRDRLVVRIDNHEIARHGMGATDGGYRHRSEAIPEEFRGGIHTITFALIDTHKGKINSHVRIDNIELATVS